MSDDKKITKVKARLAEEQATRARKKVLYDTQLELLEAQRRVVITLEERAQKLQAEYNAEHERVDNTIKELAALTEVKSQELDNNGDNGQKSN